jgi:5'-nucleotidase
MRILLTNDDGFDAPGLKALVEAVRPIAEVAVSAPDRQASATGHSISLNTPFRVFKDQWAGIEHAYRVYSTPADCVRTAVLCLLPWKPDLILSGINQGANYGSLIFYSGTVAAAAEGILLGIPAAAISLTSHAFQDFTASALFARRLVEWIGENGIDPDMFLNVNVPAGGASVLKGVAVTHQGKFRHIEDLAPHQGLDDHYSYILNSPSEPIEEDPGSDVAKVREGYISLTPLHLNMTAHHHFGYFSGLTEEKQL